MPQHDPSSARFVAVCIRCGHVAAAAASCAACGGVVIQTREGQAVRASRPELSRALRLPGIDDAPRRIARGTLPPVEPPRAADVVDDAAVAQVRGRARAAVAITATLFSAGLIGLIAALVQASF